ncbi:MAG: RraA family protein [Verrucomicrobia bacterium]|nr:RraA family protein [Verrucomicrobiota bacterium]
MKTTISWSDDAELFALARRELFTALVGDAMDKMGLVSQFLPPYLKPLRDDMVVIGRAMTVLEADGTSEKPFGRMFEALDDLKPDEVYVCAGASPRYALWGEMMSTRALKLGAAGAVVDGYSRDTRGILRLNFPTFSRGRYAQDQGVRGHVVDFRVPVRFGEVTVNPGDIVFGDLDGVCVVPRAAEVEAFTKALEKARGEKLLQKALENGMSTVEAFRKFGIM